MSSSRFTLIALALFVCASCAEENTTGAGGASGTGAAGGDSGTGGDGGAGTGGSFVPPGESLSITWGPYDVESGDEETRCVVKRLGNTDTVYAHQIFNELGATSHHFIVYKVGDTVEQPEPFSCNPFLDTLDPEKGAPIMITQKAEDLLTLPDGVVYELEPNQMIRLELHFINVLSSTQEASATSTFIPIPEDEVEAVADVVFFGDGDISIPARESYTLGPSFIEAPAALDGVSYFAITGHQHKWGRNVYVETAANAGAPGTPVYDVDNFLWDEPETVTYATPFTVPTGGGFNITCDWTNQSDRDVDFGIGVNDEMCFFWAYYYPSNGAVVCVNNIFGISFCCPGPLCDLLPF